MFFGSWIVKGKSIVVFQTNQWFFLLTNWVNHRLYYKLKVELTKKVNAHKKTIRYIFTI